MTQTKSSPNRFTKYSTPRWKPEEIGDAIAGTLVAVNELTGRTTGDVFPVIMLATDEGETEVFCSPVDLKRQLAEKNPKDGEWVDIELTASSRRPWAR